jgi:glutaredoxin
MIPGLATSEIYRWADENGEVHFSDKPSQAHASEVVKLRINTYKAVTYDTSSIDVGKSVVMYSASWCGVCKKVRRYFEQKGIRFTECDVETNAKGKSDYRQLGAKGVPVILVGNRRMNGFSVAGFEQLYH